MGLTNVNEQFKVGVILRQAREAAGLTQEELAQSVRLVLFTNMIWPKSGDALDEEEKALKRLRGAVDRLGEEIKAKLSGEELKRREDEVRALCAELFPDKLPLFDQLYGRRFQRLQEQFGNIAGSPDEDN